MPHSLRRNVSQALLLLFIVIAAAIAAPAVAAATAAGAAGLDEAKTREAMRAIFSELQTLLPAVVGGSLGDSKRADEFGSAFRRMMERADALDAHGSPLPSGARLFARVLAQDIRRAEAFFARQHFDSASFLVTSIVEDCTACHTRQKSTDGFISRDFVNAESIADLDPLERAAIAIAIRRFRDGLSLYEQAFAEPGISPEALLGPIVKYLTTAVRVTREPDRAAATVSKLISTPGLSGPVKEELEHWKAVLRETTEADLNGTTLAKARAAVSRAKNSQRYPADQRALVEFLIASAQLQDLEAKPQDAPDDVAEIFKLLGETELGIAQSLWLSRADLYWENAIRVSPTAPAAKRAFALLEREVRAGYTGSSGLHLPRDEAARIEELRALVGSEPLTDDDGGELFAQHCALCHGAAAEGYGPLAQELMWVPADLTRIAARRGGKFPEDEVFRLIARRDPLGSHKSPEMPRWGEYWSDDSKIDALVEYLKNIQQP